MNVFLTGGTGFLGACLTRFLIESESVEKLHILYRSDEKRNTLIKDLKNKTDSLSGVSKSAGNLSKCKWVKGDFFNSGLADTSCDVLVHAGAMRNITKCEDDKELAYQVNVNATRKLINDAERVGCRRIVFISSQSIYDFTKGGEHSEDEKPNPRNVRNTRNA